MRLPHMKKNPLRCFFCGTIAALLLGFTSAGAFSAGIQGANSGRHPVVEQTSVHSVSVPDTLYASGSPVGIRLESDGVTILGFVGFMSGGTFVNPGVQAGLQTGDCIRMANHIELHTSEALRSVVAASSDGRIILTVRRNQRDITVPVTAYRDDDNHEFRLGVWVRDTVTGIGTMTFYNPETHCFAALGHGISDENGLCAIAGGDVCRVSILDAVKGKPGAPGELKGFFPEPIRVGGRVVKNSDGGVLGVAGDGFSESFSLKAYPVRKGEQVHTGKASILTTVCGYEPVEYTVEITAVLKDRIYDTKGLTLRVTDPRLLEKTGGIVQGMSGSPILQDGCIIGAVTHVTMQNPAVGYGIFIESMLAQMQTSAQPQPQFQPQPQPRVRAAAAACMM